MRKSHLLAGSTVSLRVRWQQETHGRKNSRDFIWATSTHFLICKTEKSSRSPVIAILNNILSKVPAWKAPAVLAAGRKWNASEASGNLSASTSRDSNASTLSKK